MKKLILRKKAFSVLVSAVLTATCIPAISAGADDSDITTIKIVHTNDIHGYYTATDKGAIGFAKLKTLIDSQNADLVLDAGDTYHGQAFATVEQGMSIAMLMKEVGYDATTPGNHDWSYGKERLLELEEAQGFPVLASNVVTNDNDLFFTTPYLVKEVEADNGSTLRVGVLGVIDDSFYNSTSADNVTGITFNEEAKSATETAETLRDEENCDLVIAITHQSDCESFVKNTKGIDAVIAGHEHKLINENYNDADGNSVAVVEAGYYFNDIGVLSVSYDENLDKVVAKNETVYTSADMAEIVPDENISNKISEIETDEQTTLNKVIGHSDNDYAYSWEDIRTDEQKIGRICTAAFLDRTGADVAIENAGDIRAGITAGDITYKNLISISPYANTLVTKKLKGSEILSIAEKSLELTRECNEIYDLQKQAIANGEDPYVYSWPSDSGSVIQFGGLKAEYDMSRDAGSRIVTAKIGGEAVDPDKLYTVVTNNYTGDNTFYEELAAAPLDKEYGTCEQALTSYFAKGTFEEAAEIANLTVYVPQPDSSSQADSSSSSQAESSEYSSESVADSSSASSENDSHSSDYSSTADTKSSSTKVDSTTSATPQTGFGGGTAVIFSVALLAAGICTIKKTRNHR